MAILMSEEEISLEVFDYLTGIVSSALDKAAAGKTTAREKLLAILDYYHNNLASSEIGGCPLLNFGTEADDTNPVSQATGCQDDKEEPATHC